MTISKRAGACVSPPTQHSQTVVYAGDTQRSASRWCLLGILLWWSQGVKCCLEGLPSGARRQGLAGRGRARLWVYVDTVHVADPQQGPSVSHTANSLLPRGGARCQQCQVTLVYSDLCSPASGLLKRPKETYINKDTHKHPPTQGYNYVVCVYNFYVHNLERGHANKLYLSIYILKYKKKKGPAGRIGGTSRDCVIGWARQRAP